MTTFLCAIIVIASLDVVSRVMAIAKRKMPEKTWAGYAADLVCNWGLLTWAIVLLSRS